MTACWNSCRGLVCKGAFYDSFAESFPIRFQYGPVSHKLLVVNMVSPAQIVVSLLDAVLGAVVAHGDAETLAEEM